MAKVAINKTCPSSQLTICFYPFYTFYFKNIIAPGYAVTQKCLNWKIITDTFNLNSDSILAKLQRWNIPRPPYILFECLCFNLILNKMPVDQKCQHFHINQALDGMVSLMEFSKAAIIIFWTYLKITYEESAFTMPSGILLSRQRRSPLFFLKEMLGGRETTRPTTSPPSLPRNFYPSD